jgi:hypothetical protein
LPGLLALGLFGLQLLASRWLWPHAELTFADLVHPWPALVMVSLLGLAMVSVDLYFVISVTDVDQPTTEQYLDQAEYWLKDWKAPVVRLFTFGRVDPRQMVAVEVQKALVEASKLLNATLWWVNAQVGLRLAFGLALWGTWVSGEW